MERRGDYSYKEQHCSGDSEMSCNQVLRQLSAADSSVLCSSQRVFASVGLLTVAFHSSLHPFPPSFSSLRTMMESQAREEKLLKSIH